MREFRVGDAEIADRPADVGPRPEFAIDVKINRPMVSEPESIRRIMACSEDGLIVAQNWALETTYFVPRSSVESFMRMK